MHRDPNARPLPQIAHAILSRFARAEGVRRMAAEVGSPCPETDLLIRQNAVVVSQCQRRYGTRIENRLPR